MSDTPRVLGNRYEVGELLGRGGMAEVHLGRDARLGRTVAIKLLRADLARDATFQARFRREGQSAAALNHPAIVAVYDTGEEQVVDSSGSVFSLPYIVMEYIEGRTLRDVISEGHHLDVDAALEITTGVLTALEYSHRIGIVHRDIKPANVMLTPVGDVKVMDFGIARAMADASSTMTQTHAVIGTAQYLSPEQARGEQVDTRSDLYSAGCLLYELLTGRPPFVADSPVAVAYQHVREMPVPPSHLVAGIPESVDRIVLHALAKGRDERYQTAADFRADVEAARGGRQVYAAAPAMQGGGSNNATTQFVPTPDVAGTRAMPPVAAAGYPQPTGLGGANPYDQYPPEPAYGRQPRQQEPRRSNLGPILVGVAIVVVLALVGFLVTKLLTDGGAGGGTTVSMPSLLKQPEETAKRTLTDLGFKDSSITTTQEKSDTVTKGSVIKQDPQPKASVSTADQVTLTISSGRDTVSVPDLAGDTVADATAALKKAGLSVGDTKTVEETSRAAGRVVKTDPTSDEDVKPGSSVILYVASSQVTVPSDLVNKTYSDAKAELAKFGLKVRQVKTPTTDVDPGTVMSASPGGGSKVSRGSTVTLEVAVAQTDETATTGPTSTPSGQPTDTQPTQNPTTEPGAGGTTDPTNSSDDG